MDIIEQRKRSRLSWITKYPHDCRTLWVIGYPRSGTSFTARVLGDALLCPVFSIDESGDATDAVVTNKQYTDARLIVRRGHWNTPDYNTPDNPYGTIPFRRNRGSRIVFVVRDPRDVVVSCHQYTGFTFSKDNKGLEKAVKQLCGREELAPIGIWRGKKRGGWAGYVEDWLDTKIDNLIRPGVLRYTDLISEDGARNLQRAMRQAMFGAPDVFRIEEALANNTVEAWEARNDPALKFKRRTGAGHYKEELPKPLQEMIVNECGDVMERLGYDVS